MNDNYVKFEFKIQLLHAYHESNGDSVYTVSVYKIYSYFIYTSHFIYEFSKTYVLSFL